MKMSLDRVDFVVFKPDSLTFAFRGKDDELLQTVVEIENVQQGLMARRVFAALLTIEKNLKKNGVHQEMPPEKQS